MIAGWRCIDAQPRVRCANRRADRPPHHGAPEGSVRLDFAKVTEAYTKSLLASRSSRSVDEVISEILPVAKTYRYAAGFTGLARALDPEGRERLKARLSTAIEAGLKREWTDCLPALSFTDHAELL